MSDVMSKLAYRPDIDGLRTLAVWAVLIYHAFPRLLPGGFIGVDIFFVISGFLITGIIVQDSDARSFSFARFYARRVRRIFPALSLVLICSLLAGYFLLLPEEFAQLGKHVAAGALFLSNIVLWTESSYFDAGATQKILLHLWSLGIEEQFYVFWPILLVGMQRLRLPLLGSVLFLFIASFLANLVITGNDPTAGFYLPYTRAWELLAGGLLAISALRLPAIASWAGVACIVAGCLLFSDSTLFPGWAAIVPVLGTFLLIGSPTSFLNRSVFSHPVAVAFGKISYPLYLWHWPLLVYPRIVLGHEPEAIWRAGALALSIALAAATYWLLERPLRGDVRLYLKASALASIVGLTAIVGISARDGWAWRPPIAPYALQAGKLEAQLAWPYSENENCLSRFAYPERREGWWFCMLKNDAPPTVFLMGNSFANHLYPGIVDAPAFAGENVLSFGMCDPGIGLSFTYNPAHPCYGERRQRLEQFTSQIIRDNPSIKTVVLSAPWPRFSDDGDALDYFDGSLVEGIYQSVPPEGGAETSSEAYMRALERRIKELDDAKIKTVLVLMTPETGYDPRTCLNIRPFGGAANSCRIDLDSEMEKQRNFRAALAQIQQRFPSLIISIPCQPSARKAFATWQKMADCSCGMWDICLRPGVGY